TVDATGSCLVDLPVGRVDLGIDLTSADYATRIVESVEVFADRAHAVTVELQRAAELAMHMKPMPDHAVFVLRDDQASEVSGPYEKMEPPANCHIDGVNLWLREPASLSRQLVRVDHNGTCRLHGLDPGRYTLCAFPDDLVFDPLTIEVALPQTSVEVR